MIMTKVEAKFYDERGNLILTTPASLAPLGKSFQSDNLLSDGGNHVMILERVYNPPMLHFSKVITVRITGNYMGRKWTGTFGVLDSAQFGHSARYILQGFEDSVRESLCEDLGDYHVCYYLPERKNGELQWPCVDGVCPGDSGFDLEASKWLWIEQEGNLISKEPIEKPSIETVCKVIGDFKYCYKDVPNKKHKDGLGGWIVEGDPEFSYVQWLEENPEHLVSKEEVEKEPETVCEVSGGFEWCYKDVKDKCYSDGLGGSVCPGEDWWSLEEWLEAHPEHLVSKEEVIEEVEEVCKVIGDYYYCYDDEKNKCIDDGLGGFVCEGEWGFDLEEWIKANHKTKRQVRVEVLDGYEYTFLAPLGELCVDDGLGGQMCEGEWGFDLEEALRIYLTEHPEDILSKVELDPEPTFLCVFEPDGLGGTKENMICYKYDPNDKYCYPNGMGGSTCKGDRFWKIQDYWKRNKVLTTPEETITRPSSTVENGVYKPNDFDFKRFQYGSYEKDGVLIGVRDSKYNRKEAKADYERRNKA